MKFNSNLTNTNYKTVAYTYECLNSSYEIGLLYAKSEDYFIYVLVADAFISTFFVLFFVFEIFAEQKATQYFKD